MNEVHCPTGARMTDKYNNILTSIEHMLVREHHMSACTEVVETSSFVFICGLRLAKT